jgi:hypothetical protein
MFRILLPALFVVALLFTPGGAYAQRVYKCVDDKGAVHVEQGVLPAWCASQYAPVAPDKPATPQELEGTKRWLEGQLATEIAREARCKVGHERIEELKDDALDSIDSRADNRRSGRVSRADSRDAKRVEESAASGHARLKRCAAEAQRRADELRATLSDPAKLKALVPEWRAEQLRTERESLAKHRAEEERRVAAARAAQERERAAEAERRGTEEKAAAQRRERERVVEELRHQWLGLLREARGGSEILAGGGLYDVFAQRLQAIGQQYRLIRTRYAALLQQGEHRALGMAVYEACIALHAADAEWQKEQQAASDLAIAQAAADRYKGIAAPTMVDRANAGQAQAGLLVAQQRYEQAKGRLASQREVIARLIGQASRVAGEDKTASPVTATTKTP